MEPQVFISYASADKTIADRICEALEKVAVVCWIAPRDIPPGVNYPAAIVEAVRSARVLVLILTENATGSPHILSEVGHAFSAKKCIIPFRVFTGPLPEDLEFFLSTTQWLDAPGGFTDANMDRLTGATLSALKGKLVIPPVPVGWQRWLAVAGVVAAIGAGTLFYWRTHRAGDNSTTVPTGVVTTNSPRGPSENVTGTQTKAWVNPADGLTYAWIPPGDFTMGCSEADGECAADERPAHAVSIDKGFWLGQTEVTRAAYAKFATAHHLRAPEGDGDLPATEVTWGAAKTHCAAVGGRLPTEAEWEYAARGGKPQAYYGVVPDIAWYAANSGDAPHPVGKKKPNAYGLYDMLGNVREWVLDRYYNKYDLDAVATGDNVEQPLASNASAVARGGFWASEAAGIRVSHRAEAENDAVDPITGWRCASDHR